MGDFVYVSRGAIGTRITMLDFSIRVYASACLPLSFQKRYLSVSYISGVRALIVGTLQPQAIMTLLLLVAVWLPVGAQPSRSPALTTTQPSPTPLAPLGAAQQQPSVIRIEPVGPIQLAGDKAPSWTYWVPVVGPMISGLLAFAGAWLGLRIAQRNTLQTVQATQKTSEAAMWQKANETELRDIQEKLDKFYGPFTIRLKTGLQLARDIRSRQPEGYRMLVKLFDPIWLPSLSAGDRKLVQLVCENAGILERLIAENVGSMDKELIEYFSRASAHFRILRLAYERELGDDPKPFKSYVYPRQLDSVLDIEMNRLNRRVADLRANPGAAPGPMPALIIPKEHELPPWPIPDHLLRVESSSQNHHTDKDAANGHE